MKQIREKIEYKFQKSNAQKRLFLYDFDIKRFLYIKSFVVSKHKIYSRLYGHQMYLQTKGNICGEFHVYFDTSMLTVVISVNIEAAS